MNTQLLIPTPEPRIARFETLAYGMFIHWGLYSQMGRGEWVQNFEQISVSEYAKLQDTFTARDFDARAIAKLAREAGMKYITLTTRHHEGFSLYDTRGLNDFDAPHSPAGRDLVAEFVEGCRAEGIIPFFYHTTLDWRWDSANCSAEKFDEYLDYLNASVETLCANYGEIGGLWFDGNWSRPGADWKEDRMYATIRRHQPEAMIINNTGLDARGALGNPELDSTTFEQGLPTQPDRRGWPKYVSVEMCQTMNTHWGVGANDFDYLSPGKVIQNLSACRKAGANYLLNVGPTATGAIPEYETATLRRAGDWVKINGDSIYETKPTDIRCQGRDFVLRNGDKLYYFAHDLGRIGDAHVTFEGGSAGPRALSNFSSPIKSAKWMDSGEDLSWAQNTETKIAALNCTGYPYGSNLVVRVAEIELG
ncbi:alpha-L-fucosidase [Capsulimonas corticalis]|uniref:alpha-L-fucosidase n=1 Tax=Capsulimonas corticalis TaxID=2219043 RepID=A0A402CZZ3_9BACT|nr:alpha-L-fucosidase [Capsulimonas corticalis]BDI33788.1 alpha-L-fucosidase [Capsulimonas corticalis]